MRAILLILLSLTLFPLSAQAGEPALYKDDLSTLEGWWEPAACAAPKGTVIIVHQWKGLGEYEKSRAKMLADQCYNAFAADIYGQGIRPQTTELAGEKSSQYKNDPDLARRRMNAALIKAKELSGHVPARIAVIGYCFGGTMALELARSGANFNSAIAFHGGLEASKPAEKDALRAYVVAHHGAADPHVPPEQLAAFSAEMAQANADYTIYSYKDAVHAFTEKEAGDDPSQGAAYNEAADELSWARTLKLLEERLQ